MEQQAIQAASEIPAWAISAMGTMMLMLVGIVVFFVKRYINRIDAQLEKLWERVDDMREKSVTKTRLAEWDGKDTRNKAR